MNSVNEITIREMSLNDLEEVAKVHIEAFPKSFITQLGRGAVSRYYKWQLVGPHDHYCIVAVFKMKIVGFCVGGISRGSLIGFLKKYKVYLAMAIASKFWLLMQKKYLFKFTFAFQLLLKRILVHQKKENQTFPKESYGILAICVSPEVQGQGISQKLMQLSEIEAIRRGFKKMHLTVDVENHRAIRFYEKLGYFKVEDKCKNGFVFMEKDIFGDKVN
jgi:ribosomal protein S18 acetylase RimI-like enzyme